MVAAVLMFVACHRDPHFITDKDYCNEVHADFEARMTDFPMLEVQLDTLSAMEREAMEFLYAYMPLSRRSTFNRCVMLSKHAKRCLGAKIFLKTSFATSCWCIA